MTKLRRILTATAFAVAASGMASAASIGYLSNIVGPTTANSYDLTLTRFDTLNGARSLTGVTLYFSAGLTISNFTITSLDHVSTQQFQWQAQSNLVATFTNSATAADKYTGQRIQTFDNGADPGNGVLGNCTDNPGSTVPPASCLPFTLAPDASINFATVPYTVHNYDANYGLPSGQGSLGLRGVVKAGTAISNYTGASATFVLHGTTTNSSGGAEVGGVANNSQLTQLGSATYQAEVDYSYTQNALTQTCPSTTATAGTAYASTLTATSGLAPFTFSITPGTLPAGLTLNTSTGAITGIPTTSGLVTFTSQVTDSQVPAGTGSKVCSITVAAPPTLGLTCSANTATVGTPYSSSLVATGGVAPYTYSISAGSLPAGLTLNTATGAITGTPTAAGTVNFTSRVVDSQGTPVSATSSCGITVGPALALTCAANTASAGTPYSSALLATGGNAPYSYSISAGSLPAGLTLNASTGAITGTPTTPGTVNFTSRVTDSAGTPVSVTSSCGITVSAVIPPLSLSCAANTATAGTPYSSALIASGGVAPYSYSISAGTLPAGLTLNASTGAITGTPTAPGTVTFTSRVTDSQETPASVTSSCGITVSAVIPTLTVSCAASTAIVGVAYNSSLVATGGAAPYTFSISAGSLPAGLTLNPSTGAITGTPTAAGLVSFTSRVTDSQGTPAISTSSCGITATPAAPPPPPASLPVLSIAKTHSGTFVQNGTGTFSLTVSNSGGTSTIAPVTVNDPFPAGLTPGAATGAGWTCGTAGQTVTCTRPGSGADTLVSGASYPAITVPVTIAANVAGSLTNTATVSGGGDPNSHSASDTVGLSGLPDLTIAKSHAGAIFTAGGPVTFALAVSNVGGSPTAGVVTVSDTLPAGLTATAISGSGWTCSLALTCTTSTVLAAGAGYPPISVTATIAQTAKGVLVNNATVGGGGETNLTNDTASDSISVTSAQTVPAPDLTISKSHAGTTFSPGGTVTFTLTASNVGTAPTAGTVTVTDSLPAGLTATAATGAGWTCTLPISCTTSAVLAVNAAYPPIEVTAAIAPDAKGVLVNNATVGGGGETNLTNDTASDSITVLVPDLTITKSHTGTTFSTGGTVTFTLTASNVGTGPTSGIVTVADALPAGLTATAISGPAPWSCALASLSCTTSTVLAAGAAYPAIAVTANITATGGTLLNNATVAGGGESNLTNDAASDSILVSVPDLTITKSHSGTSFVAGGTATFSLTASNIGNVPTSGTVTVTDTLPAGLTATAASGTGWTCTLTPLACTTTVALSPGGNYPPISIVTSIASSASGVVTNNATVGGGGEANLTNDAASDPITVVGLPDLTIVKTHTGTMARGATGTYNLAVSNVGGSPTVGTVTVLDPLPAGLTATAISGGPDWVCVLSPLGCTTNTVLAPGAAYAPIVLTVSVDGNAPASLTNIATVSGGGETNTTNNTSPDPTNFTGTSPNLLLTKTFAGTAIQGGTGSYLLTVTNNGTGPTSGEVSVVDPLTTGLIATGISGPGWTCAIGSVSCKRSDVLAAGASYPPVTVAVSITSNAPSTLVNVASTQGGGAPSTSAGTAANTVPVTTILPTIVVTKTVDRSSAQLGDVIGYRVVITNKNEFPFTNDVINDILPAGFEYLAGSARLAVGSGPAQAIDPGNTPGVLIFKLGTMGALEVDTITYRVRLSGKTRLGQNVNRAQFTGTNPNGLPVASQVSGVGVNVSPGLFTLNQFLIGRVFEDTNGNGSFDKGERPFAGVRIYISNGDSASTDSQGLYNIPLIAPGSVVVALDAATVPKGYTLSSGGRLDAESWSRMVRTPLQGGAMLRQNFALKKCPNCAGGAASAGQITAAPVSVGPVSTKSAARIEVLPQQESIAADGRSTMTVRVRVVDDEGKLVPAKEIRVRSNAGQFVPATDTSVAPVPFGGSNLLGVHTTPQLGRTTEQVPETLQAGVARMTQGEATFQLMAANQPGTAQIVAESGDHDHMLQAGTEVVFLPEKRTPILVADGEVSVGRAAPDVLSYGQNRDVVRHADAFLRTPLGSDYLMTLAYTSHLTINGSNGNAGLFQLDPLDRVYQVFGDSSTQYQMAQSNSHVYGRLDHKLSYLLFGDIRMGDISGGNGPTAASQGFVSDSGFPQQNAYGAGGYNRNVVGAAVHLEDKHHDSLTLQGARPNTAYARDVFAGSTFGLIQLSHVGIVPGSETGVLEVRDRHNPEILLSREDLVRSADYSIDTVTGGIFFLRTLNAFDMNLNLIQLVFTYEYQTIGQTSSVYGIRGEVRVNSVGLRLGMGLTDQRDPTAGSYYLGNVKVQENLPHAGHLSVEVPVSHGSALAAGFTATAANAATDVNGVAIRADLDQPIGFMQGRVRASFSKTEQNFFNPFGATAIPGAQTSRGSVELSPIKKTRIQVGFMDERNRTGLVNNQRQTGSLEVKQFLTEKLSLVAGYDYRDFQDALNTRQVNSNEVNAGLDWRPTSKLSASVKREQNLTSSDPTYPNETLLAARYQVSETARLFLTQRFASAPITPIGDLTTSGLVTPLGKNETTIGIEEKWSRYTSISSGYRIENGINGTDSYALIGLVNRIPLQEHVSIDLGLERGQLVTGKDGSFNSGTVGFSWLPVKSFRTSSRYELRDRGGLGQIFTTGAAGRLADGLTLLGRYQHSSAAYQPGTGAIDLLNPVSTNPLLSQQTNANLGTAALAWRNWKTDRQGLLFSWTLRSAGLNGINTSLPQNDRVSLLMTDGYYQPHRRVELYGKFAFSDRLYNYPGDSAMSTLSYLYQGRTQVRVSRRFDAAVEARFVVQPVSSINQWTMGAEGGFWLLKDLRVGLGYNFKSADQISGNFLTNPVRQGVYFVLSSKLSNMFNLFNPGECNCAKAPVAVVVPPPPAPKPAPVIRVGAITGARDVCPGENVRLSVTASGWLPEQTPAYQWYINEQPLAGATDAMLMVPTADGSGLKAIRVKVSAGDVSGTSESVSVNVKRVAPPTIQFAVSPATIAYGERAPLRATAAASECAEPATIVYTASEGAVVGGEFDSTGVRFDMTNRAKAQSRTVQLTATATDRIGKKAAAPAAITVTLQPEARRLDDIVFAKNNDRVNNCGKRLLLDELMPMLRSDPEARVILIGHRDGDEKKAGVDEARVINAAAILSAGTGICPQLDLSRVLMNAAGTDQASETRPALCGSSTNVKERPGQGVAESDTRAAFRRVEIWVVPGGAPVPAALGSLRPVPMARVTAVGCPR